MDKMPLMKLKLVDVPFPTGFEFEVGQVIYFAYETGNHPDEYRELKIETVYPGGNVGGPEELVANGEYRQFNPRHMYDVQIEIEVEDIPEPEPAPAHLLAEHLGIEDHELEIFQTVLVRILDKLPKSA